MDTEKSSVCDADQQMDFPESEVESLEPADSFFFNIRGPMWKYIIRMWLIALVPSIAFAIILEATGILTQENGPDLSGGMPAWGMFLGIVVISPVVETLIMCVVFKVLSFTKKGRYALAVMSCVVWAGLHSLASPPWGLTVAWPFFIFSCSYLAWRRRSWWHAVSVTCLIHMLQNLLPGIVLFVDAIK